MTQVKAPSPVCACPLQGASCPWAGRLDPRPQKRYVECVPAVPRTSAAHNNALHQTEGARGRPLRGRSLRAPFAGEGECWADLNERSSQCEFSLQV